MDPGASAGAQKQTFSIKRSDFFRSGVNGDGRSRSAAPAERLDTDVQFYFITASGGEARLWLWNLHAAAALKLAFF